MSDAINNAKSWEIASIVKGVSNNGKQFAKIVFNKDVKVLVGNRELDKGEYDRLSLFLNDAVENLNYKLEKGFIDQAAYNKSLENIEKHNIASIIRGNLA